MLTAKEETYAQLLFQGVEQYKAWGQSGYSTNYSLTTIAANASRKANQSKIKARVEELRNLSSKARIINYQRRQEILSEIAEGRFSQFTNDKGKIEINKDNLKSAALQEVKAGKKGLSIKLKDSIPAIAELNKMDGVYGAPVDLDEITGVMIARLFSEQRKQLKAGAIEGEVVELPDSQAEPEYYI